MTGQTQGTEDPAAISALASKMPQSAAEETVTPEAPATGQHRVVHEPEGPVYAAFLSELEIGTDSSDVRPPCSCGDATNCLRAIQTHHPTLSECRCGGHRSYTAPHQN